MSELTEYVKQKLADNKLAKDARIICELKQHVKELDTLSEDILLSIFNKCISLRQQNTQNTGYDLEVIVRDILTKHTIMFKEQVEINNKGLVMGLGSKKKECYHIIDFVIGDVQVGDTITNHKVLSCKTSCRERWTQDNWTLSIRPVLYILITISDDYPPSKRFQEEECRKILTLKCKKKDDRKYKLTFEHLIEEIS
jgi:hypothetical protein